MVRKSRESSLSGYDYNFWKFWSGQTISNFGSSFTSLVFPLLIFKLTGSALNLAIAAAASNLPYLLFGLIIGAWVDQINRKWVMIISDIVNALLITTVPLLAISGQLPVWWIYLVIFLTSTISIFFDTAEFAVLPYLVKKERLVAANGYIEASYSAATVVGPLAAGLLILFVPLPMLLFIDACSFFISASLIFLVTINFSSASDKERTRTGLYKRSMEGILYVLRHPILRYISAMLVLINFVNSSVSAQFVLFAKQHLHASDFQVSLLYSAGSIGVIVLSLLAGQLAKHWSFSKVALNALLLIGVATVALAFIPWYWVAVPVWMLRSGLVVLFNINTSSLRQAVVPRDMLSRVAAVSMVLAWSATPLGTTAIGFILEKVKNVSLIFGIIGVLIFLIALAFSLTPLGKAELHLQQRSE